MRFDQPTFDTGDTFVDANGTGWQIVRRFIDVDEDDPDRQHVYELQNRELDETRMTEIDIHANLTLVEEGDSR